MGSELLLLAGAGWVVLNVTAVALIALAVRRCPAGRRLDAPARKMRGAETALTAPVREPAA